MAYVNDIAVTGSTAGGTGVAQNLPDHQNGDLLVMFIAVDTGTATISASSGAWTAFTPATVTNGIITYAWYRIATTSSETVNITTADATSGIIVAFREVDTTTPFDGVAIDYTGVGTATSTPVSVSRTPTTANALYCSFVAVEGANPMVVSSPGAMSGFMADSGGTSATQSAQTSFAWLLQRTAQATPVINWTSSVSGTYVRLSFVLRAAAGSRVPAYIDDVITPAQLIHNGSYTGALNGTSTTTNGITATIAGKTATPTTAALLTDAGQDPYLSVLTSAAAQTATTALVGPEVTITTAINCTGKLVAGAVVAGNWKQAKFGVGSVKQGGVVIRLGSGTAPTTAWNAYQVAAKDSAVPPATPTVFVIEPGYAGTAYGSGTSNTSITDLKFVQCLRNAPLFSSQVGLTECYVIDKQVVAGGDSNFPVGLDELVTVGSSFRLPLIQKAGASSVVCFAPVQIGGGDAVNFKVDLGVIQFPKRASATLRDLQYHASDNKIGLYLAGKSGDTITLTNSLVTSPNPAIFEITAAATSAASWNFTGSTLIGMTTTLRSFITMPNVTFSGCPSITTNGAALTACQVVNSKVVVSSAAQASAITSTSFISSGTGHGVEITATGTYAFNGNTFTGYAASNGSTGNEAIFVNVASGSVTLNVDAVVSYRTAGATVNLIAGQKTLTLTGIISGSDVVILTAGTNTDVAYNDGATNPVTSFNYIYTYVASTFVDIAVYKVGYVPYVIRNYELQNANASLPIAQVVDRNYVP